MVANTVDRIEPQVVLGATHRLALAEFAFTFAAAMEKEDEPAQAAHKKSQAPVRSRDKTERWCLPASRYSRPAFAWVLAERGRQPELIVDGADAAAFQPLAHLRARLCAGGNLLCCERDRRAAAVRHPYARRPLGLAAERCTGTAHVHR